MTSVEREVLYDLSVAADTAELLLRETHPAEADLLRLRVTRAIEVIRMDKNGLN